MRRFIVSDLHGCGDVYYPIMHFLENISKKEEVTLYINGDLIDRGVDSADMLLDVKERILANPFSIEYLAGNHEFMMYEACIRRMKGFCIYRDDWYYNGGLITDDLLQEKVNKEEYIDIIHFISNLKIYHKFQETMNNKNIVLVHAACPLEVKDKCDLLLKDDKYDVEYSLKTREEDPFLPFKNRIGLVHLFTIIGHTPNNNPYGVEYHKEENYFNIDGGCAAYALGYKEYNHVPLVEVMNNSLRILTFNHNNEIIHGNYFCNNEFIPMKEDELTEYKSYCKNYERIKKR